MNVLIVSSNAPLAHLWAHPMRQGGSTVSIAHGQRQAVDHLSRFRVDVIVLNLHLDQGSPLAVADYANYRQPNARVIVVSADSCFSDGSIFAHLSNARAMLPESTAPADLGAMVEHYAAA